MIYDRVSGFRAIGTMTTEQRYEFAGGAWITGVRFRPGMARTFLGISAPGISAAELTDASVPVVDLSSLANARELSRRLDDARSVQEAMRTLLGSLPPPNALDPVQKAIGALAAAHGAADLDYVASQANLSPRQFRRRCLEESGLTPKHLCRVLRFRHACNIAGASTRPDWSAVAAEAEYFDQAHLIRDYRQFTGSTPGRESAQRGARSPRTEIHCATQRRARCF